MAWIKSRKESAPLPEPYSLDRLRESLERSNINYANGPEESPNIYVSFFDNYFVVFSAEFEHHFLLVSAFSTGATLPPERYNDAVNWANQWNRDTIFGTALPYLEESNGQVTLRVDCAFQVEEGVTDEQLDHFIETALSCNLQCVSKYVEDLEIQVTSPIAKDGENKTADKSEDKSTIESKTDTE